MNLTGLDLSLIAPDFHPAFCYPIVYCQVS